MIQTLLANLVVASAGAWIFWVVLIPARIKQNLRRRLGRTQAPVPASGCGGCSGCGKVSTIRVFSDHP